MKRIIIAIIVAVAAVVCVSCKPEEKSEQVVYQAGISEFEGSSDDLVGVVLDAYYTELGTGRDMFYLEGKPSQCDKKVKEACAKAEARLSSMSLPDIDKVQVCVFTVTNLNDNLVIYEYQVK